MMSNSFLLQNGNPFFIIKLFHKREYYVISYMKSLQYKYKEMEISHKIPQNMA